MIHVAVLLKPYLDLILQGRKTVECRLTRQARDPYDRIEPGERIYFKQSAGPYGATALAEHVIFEDGLTSRRINEIRRDYNELICGDPGYWNYKRDSRFCTLIWLANVIPVDTGPAIRPLQGVAWLALDEEPAWRRTETGDGSRSSFAIELTPGNVRNNSVYATKVVDRFPPWAIGGRTKSHAAKPITLVLHDGPTVHTDIVGPRHLFRTRVWGKWFARHHVSAGDQVVFTPLDQTTYLVGLSRRGGRR